MAMQEEGKAGICSWVPIVGCTSRNAPSLLIMLSFAVSFNRVTILAVIPN